MTTISPLEIAALLSDPHGRIDPSLLARLLPAPPAGVPLPMLGIGTRCLNALATAGLAQSPHLLGELTLGEFLALPAVGSLTLLEYLECSLKWDGLSVGPETPDTVAAQATRLLTLASRADFRKALLATPMPAPPPVTPLHALTLDVRTANALRRAGYAKDLSKLRSVCVRQALEFHGFGITCLRSYLASLQRWAENYSPAPKASLAVDTLDRIIAAVSSGRTKSIGDLHLPDPPSGVAIHDLRLSVRSRNCLAQAGIDGWRRPLSGVSVDELMGLPAFGVASLVDIARRLREAHERSPAPASPPEATSIATTPDAPETTPPATDAAQFALLARIAEDIAAEVGPFEIDLADPRFGDLLRTGGVRSVAAAIRILSSPGPGAAKRELFGRALLNRILKCRVLSLEEEAIEIAGIEQGSRGERMLRARFGFGDLVPATLGAVGKEHGLTRERVRQICHPAHLRKLGQCGYLPALREVVERLVDALPGRSDAIERELIGRGLVERGTEVGEIISYAKSIGVACDAVESRPGAARFASTRADADAISQLRQRMRRAIHLDGAIMLSRFLDAMPRADKHTAWERLAAFALECDTSLMVLSSEPRWVAARDLSNSAFLQRVGEVLHVSGPIHAADLRRALRREYRRGSFVPITPVLAEIATLTDRLLVDGSGRVAWNPSYPAPPLRGDTALVVDALKGLGGIADRREWQAACHAAGVSIPSFGRQSSYSPLVRKIDRGVFALVGRVPRAGEVEAIQCSSVTVRGGVVDRGWTPTGEYWISLVLSTATFETGVLPVPAAARPVLRDAYKLIDEELDASCTLTIGTGAMWGCRKLMVMRGAEPGDTLVVCFNNSDGTARLEIGDQTIVDLFDAAE